MQKLYLAFGLCLVAAACGKSNDVNRGGEGESCVSHNDCSGSLACYNYICSKSAAPATPMDGGSTTAVTPGPVLSKSGESCTKRADCESGLGCFSGVCSLTAPPPVQVDAAVITVTNTVYVVVDSGAPPTNPVLGGRGETCTKSADCSKGLICLPGDSATGLGICDLASYGLTTGTKSCYAECEKDTDCYEIPLLTTGTASGAGTVTYNSCADLLKAMTPSTADTCGDQAAISHECFLYNTYCNPTAANPAWQCSSGKQCVYLRTCDPTVSTEIMKGCPAKTRAGSPVAACNATTRTCAQVAVAGGCKSSAECVGQAIADGAGETCSAAECVCVTASGTCYRKCNADLDCAPGLTCDATQQLCKPAGACSTDAFCAISLKNAAAKCATLAGASSASCALPCHSDQDCSPSGLSTAFNGSVCGADGYCGKLGCTSNAECSRDILGAGGAVAGSVKMFCAAPVAGGAGTQWASAITD